MLSILGVLAFVVALLTSVMIHEAGHYLTAKKFGMKVTEFFLGFGQKIWSTQRGETEFGLKAIPAGGYCKIVGMSSREELSPADADRAFIKGTITQRLIVLGAGSFLHFVIGFVLLISLFAGVGITSVTNQVQKVSECVPQTATEVCGVTSTPSPAKNAGVLAGDKLVKINGESFKEWSDAVAVIRANAGKQLEIVVDRGGDQIPLLVTPATRMVDGKAIGVLGVINEIGTVRFNPIVATQKSITFGSDILANSVTSLIKLPSKIPDLLAQTFGARERDPEGLVGVVGVARVSGETASTGKLTTNEKIATFILIVASLNIFVGMFNLLPLLPLDGGHMAVAIADGIRNFWAKRRGLPKPAPIDVERLTPITMIVFVLMAGLSIVLLAADIFNPIRLNL
jgi:membrane-associated protease RseP (regulator of RpoE activity)